MKIDDFKIGHRLNVSFALTIAMLAVVVALGATRLAMVSADVDATLNDHYRKIVQLNHVKDALDNQSRHLRNALLLTDESLAKAELDQVDRLGIQAASELEQLGASLQLPAAQALFGRIGQAGAGFGAERGHVVRLARAGQKEQASAVADRHGQQAAGVSRRHRPARQRPESHKMRA